VVVPEQILELIPLQLVVLAVVVQKDNPAILENPVVLEQQIKDMLAVMEHPEQHLLVVVEVLEQ
jgi:hypothetical protein